METILLTMLGGAVTQLVTRASRKTKLSQTRVAIILSILIWAIMYIGKILIDQYPVAREWIVAFAGGTYANSQAFYSLWKKYWNLEEGDK